MKKIAGYFPIVLYVLAGLMAVATVFSAVRGDWDYAAKGTAYIAIALLFSVFLSKKRKTDGILPQPAADALLGTFARNPVLGALLSADMGIAWAYLAVQIYYDFSFIRSFFIDSLGTPGDVIDALVGVADGFLFYSFLFVLLLLFAKRKYANLALLTGVFTGLRCAGLVFGFISGIASGNSWYFYYNALDILVFGYLFTVFAALSAGALEASAAQTAQTAQPDAQPAPESQQEPVGKA